MRKGQVKIVIAAVFLLALTGSAFFLTAALTSKNRQEDKNTETVRDTVYGEVKGLCREGMEVFYHIPYGAAPAGELRWQPPQPPQPWNGVLDCTVPGEMALQAVTARTKTGDTVQRLRGTVDCLKLDIYTAEAAAERPVLVYLHGGNNQTGNTGSLPGWDLVQRDGCVFVSIDYRLGLLGFNCLPALTSVTGGEGESMDQKGQSAGDGQETEGQTAQGKQTGNFALLDMAAALQWVRENIASFGGDPSNITVSGFSAGGRDVMAMLISPAFQGLFDKALVLSGGITLAEERESVGLIAELLAPLVVEDGVCSDAAAAAAWLQEPSEEVRSYLYGLSEERLVKSVGSAGLRMRAFPQLYQDGIVLPEKGFDGAEGCGNDVPVMMVTGTTEFSIFCSGDPDILALPEEYREAAEKFAIRYGSELYRVFNTQRSAQKLKGTASEETQKERQAAEASSEDGWRACVSPVYVAQINYGGSDSESPIPGVGSFHGIEIPMLTRQHVYGSYYDFNGKPGYQNMAALFNQYLKNFLHTGDPNRTEDALSQSEPELSSGSGAWIRWEPWMPDTGQTMILDAEEKTGAATAVMADVDRSESRIIAEMEADVSLPGAVREHVISTVLGGRWFSAD